MTTLEMIYYKDDFKKGVDYRTESNRDTIDFEEFCKKYLNSSNGFLTEKVSPIDNNKVYNHPTYPIHDYKYQTKNYSNENKKYNTFVNLEDFYELNGKSKKSELIENKTFHKEDRLNSNKKYAGDLQQNMKLESSSAILHEKQQKDKNSNDYKSIETLNKKNENKSLNGILMLNNGKIFNLNKTKEPSSALLNDKSLKLSSHTQDTGLIHNYIIEQYPSVYLTEDKTSKEAQILNNFKMQNSKSTITKDSYDEKIAENSLYLYHEKAQSYNTNDNCKNIEQIVNKDIENIKLKSENSYLNLKSQQRVQEKIHPDTGNLTALEKIEKIIDEVEENIKIESENLKKIEKSNEEKKIDYNQNSKILETQILQNCQNITEKSEIYQNGIQIETDKLYNEDEYTIYIEQKLTNYAEENLFYELPKKISFNQEFSRHKPQTNRIPIQIKTQVNRIDNINSDDYLAPFQVVPSTANVKKPDGWLGLEVVFCGISKLSKLPLPQNNYSIETGDFGDDAGFWAENVTGDAIGIADGATGNCIFGYDPGDFSRNLMKICSEFFIRENKMSNAKSLLLKAYECVQNKTCYGSCTACVMTLDHTNNTLTVINVGDTGYCVIRKGKIIYYSTPDRISDECPRQLDSYPWKQETRRMGISYTNILGAATICESMDIEKDDIIIMSSDGLYDNLTLHEIEKISQQCETEKDLVERLVRDSIISNRKPDDILVLVAKVIDNKNSSIKQKFSRAPFEIF